MTKRYRFFFHYNRPAGKMSVHFRKKCYIVDDILCWQPCDTKWGKKQPTVVMQGYAESVTISGNGVARLKAIIL